jgi:chemotaxis protein methyltransferase CheR
VGNSSDAIDIIFCRNVLMYFDDARSRALIERLSGSLIEGGWLFVSPVEAPRVLWPHLVEIRFPGTTVYRKDTTLTHSNRPLQTPISTVSSPALSADFIETAEPAPPPSPEPAPSGAAVASGAQQADAPTGEAIAMTLYEQGRYALAADELVKVLEARPDNAAAMALLARCYANQGRLADAKRWCSQAAATDKLNAGWCYLLGTILEEQGDLDAAVTALRRALYLDQNYALAHFAWGNLTRRQSKPKDSLRHFRNALAILERCEHDELLAGSEGITAGRLAEIIRSSIASSGNMSEPES